MSLSKLCSQSVKCKIWRGLHVQLWLFQWGVRRGHWWQRVVSVRQGVNQHTFVTLASGGFSNFFFPFIYLVLICDSIFSFLLWFSLLFKCFNPHQQLNSFRFGPVYRLWQSIPAPYHPNTMSAHNTRSSLLWATQLALNALAFSCLSNGTAFFFVSLRYGKKNILTLLNKPYSFNTFSYKALN